MVGVVSFGICFALLLLIWHAQYLYFRRYALDDRSTFLLNAALLFVVAFYIYPLKFPVQRAHRRRHRLPGPMQTMLGVKHGKRRLVLIATPNASQLSVHSDQ